MSIFSNLSYKSRKKKLEIFYDLVSPDKNTKVLDVGAEVDFSGKRGLQLIDGYQWRSSLTAVNLSDQHCAKISEKYPEMTVQVGDACNLPFPDKSFDIIYSNAVIEHVGDFEAQKKMAEEIMRVGKSWYITTPNRWYPFEFHLRLPFITWLPFHGYKIFRKLICYNHAKRRYGFGSDTSNLQLMSASDLRKCFPESEIIKPRVTFMAETLVAYGKSE